MEGCMSAAPDAVTNAGAGASNASLAREEYSAITLYAPGRAPCALDLADNTNLWGVPPAAARAVASASASSLTRYPSLYARELRSALADYLASESLVELDPDSLATGCGSDDVLDSAIRAFARPGDTLAYM